MARPTIDAIYLGTAGDVWGDYRPGAFTYYALHGGVRHAGVVFRCPCGCGEIRSVPIEGANPVDPKGWAWDGNVERPTLKPSIQIIRECGWHGFLTAGRFETC